MPLCYRCIPWSSYTLPDLGVHALTVERCPLRLWTTVISTAVPGQLVVDVGSKGFCAHAPGPLPREWAGACVEHPQAFMKQMSVEHGIVDISGLPAGAQQISVGDVLSFIPTNAELTVSLHDSVFPIRGGRVAGPSCAVEGRGQFT